jgi:hypothetical protein
MGHCAWKYVNLIYYGAFSCKTTPIVQKFFAIYKINLKYYA